MLSSCSFPGFPCEIDHSTRQPVMLMMTVGHSQMGGPVSNQEGEQMRAAGDGDIAKAQDQKHGFGEQSDLASGLDKKKEEQARIKEARGYDGGGGSGVDVQGALGGGGKGFVGGGGEGVNSSGGGTMQSSHADV